MLLPVSQDRLLLSESVVVLLPAERNQFVHFHYSNKVNNISCEGNEVLAPLVLLPVSQDRLLLSESVVVLLPAERNMFVHISISCLLFEVNNGSCEGS